jgi:hypothetical protein
MLGRLESSADVSDEGVDGTANSRFFTFGHGDQAT